MRRLALLALLGCRPAAPAAAPTPEAEAFPDLGPMDVPADFLVEVPFTRQRGLVVIEAQIGGIDRPLRLAIDSGAPTVLRATVAAQVDAAQGKAGVADDAEGRSIEARPLQIPRMQIGDLTVGRVAAVTLALPILDRFCPPLDGVLGVGLDIGSGFLDRVPTEIDPEKKTVRFADDAAKLRQGGHTAPIRRAWVDDDGEEHVTTQLHTQISIDGHKMWVTLDTGNNGDVDLPRPVFEALGYAVDADGVRLRHGALSYSAGGLSESSSWSATVRDVRLGELTIPVMPVNVIDSKAVQEEDTLLGQELFKHFVLVIDFPHEEVRFIPAGDPVPGHGAPEFGFGWAEQDGAARVLSLLEGGPAADAGVKLGDEVIVAAGVPVDASDPASLCSAGEAVGDDRGAVEFTLKRGDETMKVELTRRPPLTPRPAPAPPPP